MSSAKYPGSVKWIPSDIKEGQLNQHLVDQYLPIKNLCLSASAYHVHKDKF